MTAATVQRVSVIMLLSYTWVPLESIRRLSPASRYNACTRIDYGNAVRAGITLLRIYHLHSMH